MPGMQYDDAATKRLEAVFPDASLLRSNKSIISTL